MIELEIPGRRVSNLTESRPDNSVDPRPGSKYETRDGTVSLQPRQHTQVASESSALDDASDLEHPRIDLQVLFRLIFPRLKSTETTGTRARLTFVQVGLLLSSLDNYCPAVGFPGQKPADLDKSRPTSRPSWTRKEGARQEFAASASPPWRHSVTLAAAACAASHCFGWDMLECVASSSLDQWPDSNSSPASRRS